MAEVRCVAPTGCLLGEGPVWSPSEGFLWWVDIKRAKLHRYNPKTGNTRRYDLPIHASALALSKGRLLMVGDLEYGLYDPVTEAYQRLGTVPGDGDRVRTNDAGVAPDGSLWFGTMDKTEREGLGDYYQILPDGQLCPLRLDPVRVTNCFAFSPDGAVFYTADSAEQEIMAFDHDVDSGVLTERRVFVSTQQAGCYPDGGAVDVEGCLWSAHWAGSRLVRYAPDGRVLQTVKLPISRPTSCAFGGRDLKTLYVTSARTGLSEVALDRQPLAGCLFALDVEVAGLPVREWGEPWSERP
ncbi:MAG: SMP-30/gluconolactonase/LRE family protein [Pseudomonadota bacterium]